MFQNFKRIRLCPELTARLRTAFAIGLFGAVGLSGVGGCSPSYVPAPVEDLAETPKPDAPDPKADAVAKPGIPATAKAPDPKPVAPEADAKVAPKFYTVRSGDTLAAVAARWGLSAAEIALWNGIANPDLVRAGERLRLTPPPSQPVATALSPGAVPRLETGTPLLSEVPPLSEVAPGTDESLRPRTTIVGGETNGTGVGVAGVGTGIGVPGVGGVGVPGVGTGVPGLSGTGTDGVDGVGIGAPLKTGPLAEKHSYSRSKLQQLQREWRAKQAADAAAQAANAAANATAGATGATGATGIATGGVALAPPGGGVGSGATASESEPDSSSPSSIRLAFGVEWSWPARGALLSGFSEESRGWDIAGESGDPVYAAADGRVIYAGSGIKGFGRLVIVKHGNDYLSAYAHNRRILKSEGASVRRGELIAEMGDTGAERVKLHFEIRQAGKPTDPAAFLPERP